MSEFKPGEVIQWTVDPNQRSYGYVAVIGRMSLYQRFVHTVFYWAAKRMKTKYVRQRGESS